MLRAGVPNIGVLNVAKFAKLEDGGAESLKLLEVEKEEEDGWERGAERDGMQELLEVTLLIPVGAAD